MPAKSIPPPSCEPGGTTPGYNACSLGGTGLRVRARRGGRDLGRRGDTVRARRRLQPWQHQPGEQRGAHRCHLRAHRAIRRQCRSHVSQCVPATATASPRHRPHRTAPHRTAPHRLPARLTYALLALPPSATPCLWVATAGDTAFPCLLASHAVLRRAARELRLVRTHLRGLRSDVAKRSATVWSYSLRLVY